MSTAYIVTTGEYSDYRIDSVWTRREDAEARRTILLTDRYNKANEVEEFPLDSAEVAAEVRCWQAQAWIYPDTGEVKSQSTYEGVDNEGVSLDFVGTVAGRLARLTVSYVDKERAEKVRSERVAQLKAQIDQTGPLTEETP